MKGYKSNWHVIRFLTLNTGFIWTCLHKWAVWRMWSPAGSQKRFAKKAKVKESLESQNLLFEKSCICLFSYTIRKVCREKIIYLHFKWFYFIIQIKLHMLKTPFILFYIVGNNNYDDGCLQPWIAGHIINHHNGKIIITFKESNCDNIKWWAKKQQHICSIFVSAWFGKNK